MLTVPSCHNNNNIMQSWQLKLIRIAGLHEVPASQLPSLQARYQRLFTHENGSPRCSSARQASRCSLISSTVVARTCARLRELPRTFSIPVLPRRRCWCPPRSTTFAKSLSINTPRRVGPEPFSRFFINQVGRAERDAGLGPVALVGRLHTSFLIRDLRRARTEQFACPLVVQVIQEGWDAAVGVAGHACTWRPCTSACSCANVAAAETHRACDHKRRTAFPTHKQTARLPFLFQGASINHVAHGLMVLTARFPAPCRHACMRQGGLHA